jgi:hypothetical protein
VSEGQDALAALVALGVWDVRVVLAAWVALGAWAEQAGRTEPTPLPSARLPVVPSGLEAHSGPLVAASGSQARNVRVAPSAI